MSRFSGHDTFHCRGQWLYKGLEVIDNKGVEFFGTARAIVDLGVGKNMVRSILHWLKSFGLYSTDGNCVTELGQKLFLKEDAYDPYLENNASLWLLQYKLCSTGYASIYPLIFSDFFKTKASNDFSQPHVIAFLKRYIEMSKSRTVSEKTLISDYKTFLKSYVTPSKNSKNIEDDFGAPLLSLNLVCEKETDVSDNNKCYSINKRDVIPIPIEVFAFCVLDKFKDTDVVRLEMLQDTIGSCFGLTSSGLIDLLGNLSRLSTAFVFKQDAGVQQLTIHRGQINNMYDFLNVVYEK